MKHLIRNFKAKNRLMLNDIFNAVADSTAFVVNVVVLVVIIVVAFKRVKNLLKIGCFLPTNSAE